MARRSGYPSDRACASRRPALPPQPRRSDPRPAGPSGPRRHHSRAETPNTGVKGEEQLMASIPHRVRLQRVMEHLGLRAERAPFYIDAATLGHRAPGWYWRPPEAEADVFL